MSSSSIEGDLHLPRRIKQIKWHRRRRLHKLEDRLLILKNKADRLDKRFDPNQVRDQLGRWAASGGGSAKVTAVLIKDAVRYAVSHPKTRAAVSSGVAALISFAQQHSDGVTEEVVKHQVEMASTNAKVAKAQVITHMMSAFERLRKLRSKTIQKAEEPEDEVLAMIDQILEMLDRVKDAD